RCGCAGVGDAVEESKSDVSLRFRWERGKMFEASATGGARHAGLSPAITAGHLVTYDFATEGAFPGGKPGSCGAHVTLTLLIEPPILCASLDDHPVVRVRPDHGIPPGAGRARP